MKRKKKRNNDNENFIILIIWWFISCKNTQFWDFWNWWNYWIFLFSFTKFYHFLTFFHEMINTCLYFGVFHNFGDSFGCFRIRTSTDWPIDEVDIVAIRIKMKTFAYAFRPLSFFLKWKFSITFSSITITKTVLVSGKWILILILIDLVGSIGCLLICLIRLWWGRKCWMRALMQFFIWFHSSMISEFWYEVEETVFFNCMINND